MKQSSSKLLPAPTPMVLNRERAAEYIGVSLPTFEKMVAKKLMPPPKQLWGRRLGWDIRALNQSIEALPTWDDSANSDNNPWDM